MTSPSSVMSFLHYSPGACMGECVLGGGMNGEGFGFFGKMTGWVVTKWMNEWLGL